MSRNLKRASAIAVAATLFSIFATSQGAGAQVQGTAPAPVEAADPDAADISFISQEVVQPLPADYPASAPARAPADAASLAELVANTPDEDLTGELQCLAGAIYFEARGEPLAGQLAVGRVIINRAASGRFPGTYCGVVYQPSQFSFVRGGRMPRINTASLAWRNAKAVARIAHENSWDSAAQDALYFHARSVSPGWHRSRVAMISRHIFYR